MCKHTKYNVQLYLQTLKVQCTLFIALDCVKLYIHLLFVSSLCGTYQIEPLGFLPITP